MMLASTLSFIRRNEMKKTIRKKYFGWVPDLPDQRDHTYAAQQKVSGKKPTKVDIRK